EFGGTVDNAARGSIAAVDATTGQLKSMNPKPNGEVFTLSVSQSRLFAGGMFQITGGIVRHNVAALDAATGAADPGFTANTDAPVHVLAAAGGDLYIGGDFGQVNSVARVRLAAVSQVSGQVDSS